MNISRPPPAGLQTPGFAHYSVAWSPFHTSRIALASAANFGLVGNGRLHLASVNPALGGAVGLNLDKQYETQDALYDVAWSELHENQLVTGSGDGSIKLWDVMLNDYPIRAWQEHSREVFSVDWSNIQKDTFVSSSWDGNVKLWTPERPRSVTTLHAHLSCVYQALFSPHQPDLIATCSTDGTLKIFDLRSPGYVSGPTANSFTHPLSAAVLTIPASGTEILSLDWNKYRPFILASAGVDKMVKVWDCRMIQSTSPAPQAVGGNCEIQLLGHEYAVRKVQWSPHRPDVLATASYDMTCRIWTTNPTSGGSHILHIHDPHTEFVAGCSWSLYDEGVLASCGWDGRLNTMSGPVISHQDESEDILSSSLETLYDYTPITYSAAHLLFTYPIKSPLTSQSSSVITLQTPDTQPANWSLHASSIWVSSLFIADHLEDLQLDDHTDRETINILELGAGAGLPSILISKLYPNTFVTVSDYPDEKLIRTLSDNVHRNGVSKQCRVVPYAWGTDIAHLRSMGAYAQRSNQAESLFDVIIAADTLWNPELHEVFLDTLCMCLKSSPDASIHLVAGLHTGRYTIQAFQDAVKSRCFVIESAIEKEVRGAGQRLWDVTRAETEDEQERRRWVVWMTLKWK
ncbi:WD40-repeat-containing domain protein [Hygrophoropsis aurantiaca]|uniref:WD40-repeat-containing domain protein n=1 Tax=Hygrophoropsis aurantiaca TaxID=72124 RepID=A0ACB8APH7_9AGAM|nr:WD40-repeat-containing domain protein [Hygrophoropsis aurantiaca]